MNGWGGFLGGALVAKASRMRFGESPRGNAVAYGLPLSDCEATVAVLRIRRGVAGESAVPPMEESSATRWTSWDFVPPIREVGSPVFGGMV